MTELELDTLRTKARAYDNICGRRDEWQRERDNAVAARDSAIDVVEVSATLLGEFLAKLESLADPEGECNACRSIFEAAEILARCHCGKCNDCRVLLQRP